MSQEFECRPQYSPRLLAVLAVRIWPISTNPETIANVNKHVKGTMLSDTLLKTGILAGKNYSFSDRVCLPSATKIRKLSEGFYLIVSTLKAD